MANRKKKDKLKTRGVALLDDTWAELDILSSIYSKSRNNYINHIIMSHIAKTKIKNKTEESKKENENKTENKNKFTNIFKKAFKIK